MEKITSRDLPRDSLGFANALKILKIAITMFKYNMNIFIETIWLMAFSYV